MLETTKKMKLAQLEALKANFQKDLSEPTSEPKSRDQSQHNFIIPKLSSNIMTISESGIVHDPPTNLDLDSELIDKCQKGVK